jgi:integrase/recombinase XerD
MAEEAINPLRRRMIEDMTIRNFDQRTQQAYIRSVRSCCRYCDRRPEELTFEDVRRFQLHLGQCGLAPSSVNGAMVALRFFFRVTRRRPEAVDYIPIARAPQRLPVVLSRSEISRLLEATPSLKWRTALRVAYGAGLRASEVVGLKVSERHPSGLLRRPQPLAGLSIHYRSMQRREAKRLWASLCPTPVPKVRLIRPVALSPSPSHRRYSLLQTRCGC